jgi:glycosyltransferase involved in cell wall biosynthesis
MNKLKILWITPGNPNMKTPETTIAEELSKMGHIVTLAFDYSDEMLDGDYDIVVGAMEYSMSIAKYVGRKLNIPVYNHMEWIPPWRVLLEDPKEWGYDGTQAEPLTPQHINHFKNMYRQQVMDWEDADMAGESLMWTLNPFKTKQVSSYIRFPTKNFSEMDKYKDDTIEEKYQIMCTARLVPHKRVIHVVKALGMLEGRKPTLKIIGYGPESEKIKQEAEKQKVNVEFLGPGNDGVKERTIQESMFSVNIWAGLPIAESFYFGKPAITYDEEALIEQYKDGPVYAKRNDIEDLSKQIKWLIYNEKERKDLGKLGRRNFLDGYFNIKPSNLACKDIEKILYEGLGLWKKRKK